MDLMSMTAHRPDAESGGNSASRSASRASTGFGGGDEGDGLTAVERARLRQREEEMRKASFKTKLRNPIKAGCDSIEVFSTVDLFGPHVVQTHEEGRFTVKMANPKKVLTCQIGKNHLVNVHSLHNNTLYVTPISVEHDEDKGTFAFFGSGPALEEENGRLDLDKIRAEVEELTRIGVYGEVSRFADHQAEALELEEKGDLAFWEGMQAERLHNPERITYCPIIDYDPGLDFQATCKYKESLSLFKQSLMSDQTRISCYRKRACALLKLRWWDKAHEDGHTYETFRPGSPTGFLIKGAANQGMKKYAAAIKELRQGLTHGTVSYYDDSRVWSTGTDVERVLQEAIKSRDGLAREGRLSNLQGMQWASIGRYNEALKSLKEGADASEQALGADNLSYATCVNNMGACLEAMGRYDEALKTYERSMKVTEKNAPGNGKVIVLMARHLPTVTFPGGETGCNPWVRIEYESSRPGENARGAVRTEVKHGAKQPVWNSPIWIYHQNAYVRLRVSLLCEHPRKMVIRKELQGVNDVLSAVRERASIMDADLVMIKSREARLVELGGLKVSELQKLREELAEKEKERSGLETRMGDAMESIRECEERLEATEDCEIGSFEYDVENLAPMLDGATHAVERAWFEVFAPSGEKVRGDDYGVCAVELEVMWEPESIEYATRLANIGNLYRIIGSSYTTLGGGHSDLKKLDINYQKSEDYLTAALASTVIAKSAVRVSEEEKALATLAAAARDRAGTTKKRDGSETLEACLILENMGRLLTARSLKQKYPKGTSTAQKAHFEHVAVKSRRQALEILERALGLRKRLSGETCPELVAIRCDLVNLHMEVGEMRDALPIQEENVSHVKTLYGPGSEQHTRELNRLNELHHAMGDTSIRVIDGHKWVVDTSESWHWSMVGPMSRKVTRAAEGTHRKTEAEDEEFERIEERMEEKRVWLHDPPKIVDYSLHVENAAVKLARSHSDHLAKTGRFGEEKKVFKAVAVASKLKTPDVAAVRLDSQRWPNSYLHTKFS